MVHLKKKRDERRVKKGTREKGRGKERKRKRGGGGGRGNLLNVFGIEGWVFFFLFVGVIEREIFHFNSVKKLEIGEKRRGRGGGED